MDDIACYSVEHSGDRWRVCSATGTVVLECADPNSAGHYVELLTKAYRAGYKAGYRDAREADRERGR